MATHSVQRAGYEGQTHRFDADLGQCGIHHAHGQAEERTFGNGIPRTVPLKSSNGRKQACNHAEDQAMGITRSRLTEQVSQEATSDEGQDGRCGRQGSLKIVLSTPEAGNSRVSAHE